MRIDQQLDSETLNEGSGGGIINEKSRFGAPSHARAGLSQMPLVVGVASATGAEMSSGVAAMPYIAGARLPQ